MWPATWGKMEDPELQFGPSRTFVLMQLSMELISIKASSFKIQEERISTFVVDQTNPQSIEALFKKLPAQFDLIIDDGLHATDANVLTLGYGLTLL